MPLLRGTLAVVALLCLSGAANGFFSGFGPKPTPQGQAKEKGWGIPYMGKFPSFGLGSWGFLGGDEGQREPDTAMGNPILPKPTTQNYTPPPLLDESTSPRYQLTTTTTERVQSNIVQLGTPLPLKSAQLPTNELLRNTQGLDRPTSFSNYDLDLWPPNNASSKAKTPQTTSPLITQPQTQTSTAQTSTSRYTTETRNVYSHQTITTETPSTTTEHRLLTSFQTTPLITPANLKPELSTEPLTTTKPEQNILGTEQMTTETNWTQFKPTDKALDGFILAEQTTGPREEEKFQNIGPEWSSTLPTGSLAREEGDSGIQKSADLATQEPHEQTTSSSTTTRRNTEMPTTPSEDWLTDFTQESALPDCNAERSGICSSSDAWPTTLPSNGSKNDSTPSTNHSQNPILLPMPPMLVALHSDWNSALATWGSAWEAHIYGLGTVFCLVALASTLNLLCLPLQYPSGCGYFALVSLSLVAAGCSRAFALVYDAYGYQDRMASTEASLLLYEAPYPCMTAAFGLVFLLLSMRSRMQLSYSAFQRPCILACLVLLHFAAAFGPVALLHVDQQGALYLFLSLISRGAFVALATFLSVAYFVFYCYVRADSKHIYHLNNTSPTPAERYNRCPFAESRDWDRAAAAVLLSAVFSLACAGLQLYAMLHALGLAGSAEAFRPWPWWTFQFSCRVCEAVVCLTLVLVVAQPVYCSDHLPQPGGCWTGLLAAKSPIIPGSYQWTLSQQEKLAICDPIGHGETECLPLYTLVDERLGSLNGLDLLYHSNRALAYRDLDLDLPNNQPNTGAPSGGSSCTSDSTADLRPPSPINLRRSIDEALFSESLFPMSLFSPLRPFAASDRSLNGRETNSILRDTLMPDPGLYRTSSCVDVLPLAPLSSQAQQGGPSLGFPPSPSPSLSSSTCCSSPERWKGSSSSSSIYRPSLAGSSLVLCSSPEGYHHPPPSTLSGSSNRTTTSRHQEGSIQRPYRTLNSQESLDQQSEFDQSVQEEFISVCKQIDSLSICSETIDL